MIYTEKLLKEARQVAIRAHGNQSYGDIFPYETHLDDVDDVLIRFSFGLKYRIAGALHDVMEDGAISYNKLVKNFGAEIAEMVYCVTDELGRNREEKKRKTLPKTATNPDAIALKLADRIANVERGGKLDMYKAGYPEFKSHLHQQGDLRLGEMWSHLDSLLLIKVV